MYYTLFANGNVIGFTVVIGSLIVVGVSILGIRFSISNRKKDK